MIAPSRASSAAKADNAIHAVSYGSWLRRESRAGQEVQADRVRFRSSRDGFGNLGPHPSARQRDSRVQSYVLRRRGDRSDIAVPGPPALSATAELVDGGAAGSRSRFV